MLAFFHNNDGLHACGPEISPARAFSKVTKTHAGYSGCDKCVQTGVYGPVPSSFVTYL